MSKQPAKMSDADAAEHYQRHKDDDTWADRGERRVAGPLDSVITIRVSAEESATIRRAADDRDMTLSRFVRAAALAHAGHAEPEIDAKALASELETIARRLRATG